MATEETWRAYAEALPEVTERPAWGMTCYRIRDKIFTSQDPHDPDSVGIAVDRGERAALIAAEPGKFHMRPGHDDGFNWMRVRLAAVDDDELRELVEDAWRLKAPKRLVKAYDEEG